MTGYADPVASEQGQREPAPGELRLVQALVNSRDIEAGVDELDRPEAVRAWLDRHDLPGAEHEIDEAQWHRLTRVREALRELLDEDAEPSARVRAREVLNREAGRAPVRVAFDTDGAARLDVAGVGMDRAIARLFAAVATSAGEGTWDRLKICRNDACRWAFYDASRNHSGAWCSMAICGNRLKTRAYRRRRADQ